MFNGRYLFAALVLAASSFAKADTIDDFVVTGSGNTITFSLPASPTNVIPELYGNRVVEAFRIPFVFVMYNGVIENSNVLFQGPLLPSGGMTIFPSIDTNLYLSGPVLFTGSELEPTFKTGTFTLLQADSVIGCSDTDCNTPYTVTITQESPGAATPEPSTLMLFATGLVAATGFGMRRRTIRQ